MAWLTLIIAGLLEVVWSTAMKTLALGTRVCGVGRYRRCRGLCGRHTDDGRPRVVLALAGGCHDRGGRGADESGPLVA